MPTPAAMPTRKPKHVWTPPPGKHEKKEAPAPAPAAHGPNARQRRTTRNAGPRQIVNASELVALGLLSPLPEG